jgi:acyl-CoA hydrolase
MDRVEFRKSVCQGAILRLEVKKTRAVNTSVHYTVEVFSDQLKTGGGEAIFSTTIIFVCLDEQGKKTGVQQSRA